MPEVVTLRVCLRLETVLIDCLEAKCGCFFGIFFLLFTLGCWFTLRLEENGIRLSSVGLLSMIVLAPGGSTSAVSFSPNYAQYSYILFLKDCGILLSEALLMILLGIQNFIVFFDRSWPLDIVYVN